MDILKDIAIPLIAALLGAIVGGYFAMMQLEKSQRVDRIVGIVEDINRAVLANEARQSYKPGTDQYIQLTHELNLALNHIFAKAMVFLPDESYREVEELLNEDFDKEKKNALYLYFRKELIPSSEITFEDVKDKHLVAK